MPIDPALLALRYAVRRDSGLVQADLNPSLGHPGGPCQVIERIDQEIKNPGQRESLVDQVESGSDLSNAEANKIYDLNAEPGPSGTRFKQILLTPHAQYRMDLRGVNVSDLKLYFKRFQKAWADARSRQDPVARQWESDMAWRQPIRWSDSQGLFVSFVVEDRVARIITVYWEGLSDPRPVDESTCALPSRVAARQIREAGLKDTWLQWVVQPAQIIRKHHREFVQGPVDDAMDIIIKELAPELVKAIGEQEVEEDIEEFLEGALKGRWDAERSLLADPSGPTEDWNEGYTWGYANPDKVQSDLPPGLKRKLVEEVVRDYRKRITEEVVERALLASWDALSPVTTFRSIWAAVKKHGWKLGVVIALVEIVETFVIPGALIAVTGDPEWASVGMLPLSEILYAVVFRILGRVPSDVDEVEEEGHLDWYEGQFGPVRLAHLSGRRALKMAPEPGIKTLVRDDSAKNLPSGLDREKEQALPLPGSATPGGAGRDIPRFESNTPDNDIDQRPRTLGLPGEEYGHPYKDDYGTVTRRTMTSAEIAVRTVMLRMGFDLEAFQQQWNRGTRQRKQRGQSRTKARQYYKRNKTNLRRKAKLWRRKNKNKGAFKQSEKRRSRSVRKRRGSLQESILLVAARYLEAGDFAPPRERGGEDGNRQREQLRLKQRDDAKYYLRNKAKRQRQSERHYKTQCRTNSRCKDRRELWQEEPDFYERGRPQRKKKEGSVLTVPEIAFGIGPDMAMGFVHSLSPMTGMVTFEVHYDNGPTIWESLSVEVFLRVAAFLSDEDIDAFFELVDAEIGLEAYEDLDEEGLRTCAALYDKDPDSDEFRGQCFDLTGEEDLGSLSADQLDQVNDSLVLGVLEGGGDSGGRGDDRDDGDESIGPEYDPHLYYGEVEMQKVDDEGEV